MSGNAKRDEALHRLECILQVVSDELSDTAGSLTEHDLLYWFPGEILALAATAWEFRFDPGDVEEVYWPTRAVGEQ